MNLRIGNVRNYNNKILISSPSFKIGTNVKINLDDDDTKVAKTDKLDVKDKPVIKPNKMLNPTSNQIKNTNKMSNPIDLTSSKILKYREANLIRMRSPMRMKRLLWCWELLLYLQYGGCSSDLSSPCLRHKICVYQDSDTCYESPQILRQPTNHFLGSIQDP